MDSGKVTEPHAFLIGAPKAGTTWLASILSHNPSICLSDPKEPNMITSHKGTFRRSTKEPDWSEYLGLFKGDGIKLDGSIHTFSCPISPARISEKFENPKFIISLREPVDRAFSHWRMITDIGSDKRWGADWDDFQIAWDDPRLKEDSLYGKSMARWLDYFPLSEFFIFDSTRMRESPEEVLSEIGEFLGLQGHNYSINQLANSNRATKRRRITPLGKLTKSIFSLVPNFLKAPFVDYLVSRDINIYYFPLLGRRNKTRNLQPLGKFHFSICEDEVCKDLLQLQELTNFDATEWIESIKKQAENQLI